MRERRNLYLAISLGVLLMISAGLELVSRNASGTPVDRNYFKIPETEKIDRVQLHSRKGNVELKFENGRWRVNDKWDADAQMIKVLFATLKQIEPRRPVASVQREAAIQRLTDQGTEVILEEAGVKQLGFRAGGNQEKTEAWFLKEGEDQPYSVNIPGYRVYASGIFELDVYGWRGKRIFDFNWRNFKSMTVTYPNDPRQSFEIEMQDDFFGIKGLIRQDTSKLNTFLDDISLLFADRFIPPAEKNPDSLTAGLATVHFEAKDIANRSFTLDLFLTGKKDVESGRTGNGDLVEFSRDKIIAIARKKDFFQSPK